MKLPLNHFGEAEDTPIVLVHGLFGQGRNFTALARTLLKQRHVITVDLRNHGEAGWDDVHDYPAMADDLVETLQGFGAVDVMGHSMGGKAAMWLALHYPALIRRIVIADIAPVNYDHSHTGLIEALLSLDLPGLKSRSDADAALATVINDKGLRAFLLQGLKLRPEPGWRNNLRVLHREMGTITAWPETRRVFEGSALFVHGELSDYVDAEARAPIKRLFPKARLVRLKDAGHWIHADQPAAFAKILSDFFAAPL